MIEINFMKKYSLRYWISKFLTALAILLALFPLWSLSGFDYHPEMLKNVKVTAAVAQIRHVLNQLNSEKLAKINFEDAHKIMLSEILDISWDSKYGFGGEMFLIKKDESEKIFLVWSGQGGAALLSAQEAYRMDRKIDDGLPYSGKMTIVGQEACVLKTQDNYVYSELKNEPCAVLYFELSGVEK